MIGVLVKNGGGSIIDKQVFAGDDVENMDIINKYISANPTLIIEVHQDTDLDWQKTFIDIQIATKVTPEQTAWQAAKVAGAQQALIFIAKKLGLE